MGYHSQTRELSELRSGGFKVKKKIVVRIRVDINDYSSIEGAKKILTNNTNKIKDSKAVFAKYIQI